jgi:TIR domain
MKPGERIDLLQRLADKLGTLSWDDIDLTLRQFGLPWSGNWGDSDTRAYALHHIESGSDEILLALHDHLFPTQGPSEGAEPSEGKWAPGRFRLFLSHISADKLLVSGIKEMLSQYAIDGFVAHEDIEPTKEWVTKIERALATCDALAAFLTPAFHASYWTDHELGYCVRRHVLIVPVRMGLDPYGFIGRYQALSGQDKTPVDIAPAIFSILVENALTAGRMAEAIVSYFEESPSFNETRRRFALIERVRSWTPALLERLEGSIQRNGEIRECWQIPDRIRALIKTHGVGN